MRAPVCDGDGSAVCARVGGLVLRARPKTRSPKPCEPFPSASTACGFGTQAFQAALAFNANIGAWNTASVTSLNGVCAASGPARSARTMADALGRASMRRGPLCSAAPPMPRGCAHVQALSRLRGALGVGTAASRGGSIHASENIHLYMHPNIVYVLHAYTCLIHLSVNARIGRRYACVHQCAMVMDRLCAHALAGSCCGLGLIPKP